MKITIEINCPHSPNLSRNGKKDNRKQNYRCKDGAKTEKPDKEAGDKL
jgi:transposase-like protein